MATVLNGTPTILISAGGGRSGSGGSGGGNGGNGGLGGLGGINNSIVGTSGGFGGGGIYNTYVTNIVSNDAINAGNGRLTISLLPSPTAVPEPLTIIGTIIGGTAAMQMRKKLKSTVKE